MRRRRKTSKEERVCHICSLSFNKAEHLERHVRSHTKEKPFQCPVCDKLFARQDTLLRHSRFHQRDQQKNSRSTPGGSMDGIPDANHASGPASSANATADSIVGMAGPDVPPESPFVNRGNGTIADNSRENNMPTGLQPPEGHMMGNLGPAYTDMSLDVSGYQRYGMLPQWTPVADINTQWMSCFAGDNFDVDILNFSPPFRTPSLNESMMDAPMASAPGRLAMTPNSDLPPETESPIQSKWHTWTPDHDTSGYMTPALSQGRCQIDQALHERITDRLQPRAQEGPVPSIKFLNLCIQAYFSNFHPIFPIIHAPSFQPSGSNSLLLLSICSIGSLFLGSPRALSRGINIYERLQKTILSSWETVLFSHGTSSIISLQASVLGQVFGLLVGRPRDLMQIELFHGCLVAWGRRIKIFDMPGPEPNVADLTGPALDQAWMEFIVAEEKKRVALSILLQDAEIGSIFHHDPLLQQCISQLPRTSSMEAFAAPTATAWKEAVMYQDSRDAAVPHCTTDMRALSSSFFPKSSSDFGLYVMLERIGALACGSHRKAPDWPERARKCEDLLLSWYHRYRGTPMYERHVASLMVLWHSIFMLVYMDLDDLECVSGRDGKTTAERHRESATAWAKSADARRCIIHSVLLQRHFERIPLGLQPPIYAPQCLYRCGIAWFCYTSFGGDTYTEAGDLVHLDLPELQALGINGTALFLEEVASSYGRPKASALFKVINLLQRMGHWGLASNLASTLLLLAEEG